MSTAFRVGRLARRIVVAAALSGFGVPGLVGTSAEGFGHMLNACGRLQITLPSVSQIDGAGHALSLLNRARTEGRVAAAVGWESGHIFDPSTNMCLALAPSQSALVRLATCAEDDPTQAWSWKAKWMGREAGQQLLVVRHSHNPLVLEVASNGDVAEAVHLLSARPFREDGTSQRFAVQRCEG